MPSFKPSHHCQTNITVRILIIAVVAILLQKYLIEGAHSRRAPKSPKRIVSSQANSKYDRSITTFNTEGRLLQVEYASKCTTSSKTGQALSFFIHEGIAIVVVEKKSSSIATSGGLPYPNNVHRIDSHILLFTTGLAGDGHALASIIRQNCNQHTLNYGEKSTVKNVATKMIGMNINHALTMMGGSRPFGVTSTVVGIDNDVTVSSNFNNNSKRRCCRIFQCDPGGIVQECNFGGAGRFREDTVKALKKYDERQQEAIVLSLDVMVENVASSMLELLEKESHESSGYKDIDSDHDKEKQAKHEIDIYVMKADDTSRGSVCIQCAKSVNRKNLSLVSNLFAVE